MPIAENQETDRPKRRILCIDGGGICGTFPAAFLAKLEQHLDKPIGSYFDLIAGSSTGGIIAIALSIGLRASDILDLYEKRGPEIFGTKNGTIRNFIFGKFRGIRRLYRPNTIPTNFGIPCVKCWAISVSVTPRLVCWFPHGIQ